MGNCLWVAYFYCLQARFLVSNPVVLGPLGVAGVLCMKAVGYYVFRSANLQKDRFKADHPSVKSTSWNHHSHQIWNPFKRRKDQTSWSTDGGEKHGISITLETG
jgi:hypothetical protein